MTTLERIAATLVRPPPCDGTARPPLREGSYANALERASGYRRIRGKRGWYACARHASTLYVLREVIILLRPPAAVSFVVQLS